MNKTIRIAMVQENFVVGDVLGNTKLVISRASEAKDKGADLVLFPELALVGYPPEDLLYRKDFLSQVETALEQIKREVKGIHVFLGAPEQEQGKLFNTLFWIGDGQCRASYRKRVLPNYSVFDEVRYFERGVTPGIVEIMGIRFGLAICEDVWQVEPLAELVSAGADVIVVINASPFHIGKYEERVSIIKQRIEETGLPVLYLNMVGGQDELVFDGESLAIDRNGKVLLRSAAFESAIEYIDVSGREINVITNGIREIPGPEEAVYKALVLGVRDFVHKNGFTDVVIGLSGGVDSALTLAIAVDALGPVSVHAILMPSRYTADMSLEDAKQEAGDLGVHYDIISIEPAFKAFLKMLEAQFEGLEENAAEENIQARCRGLILMAISNKKGSMVLTTGNKSEMAVGYATLYGDMSGGFAPLKDVSKTLVYKLCRYRNGISKAIPERVLTRPPTAELRPGQCDQDTLPDYQVLDRILELSVEQDMPFNDILNTTGIDREVAAHVINLVQKNEYKRRQSAPGVRITKRAFGRDRRYPITSGYRRD